MRRRSLLHQSPPARRGLNQLLFAFAEYCAKENGLVLADMILILRSQNNSGAARNFSLMGDQSSLGLGKLLDWYLPGAYLRRPSDGASLNERSICRIWGWTVER